MDFQYGEDRRMLADMLGRYLKERYAIKDRHLISAAAGWSQEHWSAMAELGIVGMLFGEDAGGFGGSAFDIAVVFEELGKALVIEPFLGTLMSGRVLAGTGLADLLRPVIAGSAPIAFAHDEAGSGYDLRHVTTSAHQSGGAWRVSGAKAVVPQLAAAGTILLSARVAGNAQDESGISLFLVDAAAAGVTIRDYPLIDGGRGGDLVLDNVAATPVGPIGEGYALVEGAVAAGIVALSWEAVGVMDVIRASTLEYLRTRKQFGVPIGKFQALQHRMATVAIEIEQARSAAINAADALDGERRARERAVSAAKFTIGRVGTLVAEEAIQMHGGMGMTWELPLSHYAKRLTMIGHQLGDEDHHLVRFAALGRAA